MWTFICSLLMQLALLIAIIIGCLKGYILLTMGVCKCTNKLTGKTVIITGANTGIGKETAVELAKRGARVILACRDAKKAYAAKGVICNRLNKNYRTTSLKCYFVVLDDIIRESGNENVVFRHLDLASLKSVRKFSADIVKSEPCLDILINNAGCITLEKKLTEDGLEDQMQTNYFGHFLLTHLFG
jgi:NAD(P)-dependent dehydrogenase (short-subunit alcohol dehydrogenase family)